ncbi:hypothetical protein AX16_001394 [Volvariella volvacea WC 439]|nr:hypothetical protein AX16_001394 [Volvariella volvacea WC 439]
MQTPSHVYSLPSDFLETLTPRSLFHQTAAKPPTPEPKSLPNLTAPGGRGCNICLGSTFLAVDDQRAHFRSDWHRYNVRLRLKGANPVSETEFADLVDRLEDSLSGSASSDDESNDSDAVDTLINKVKQLNRSPSPSSEPQKGPQTAVAWFHSPPSTQIGVYKALFPKNAEPSQYLSELKAMQHPVQEGRTWAMFMVAGGHFAGAVIRVSNAMEEEREEPAKKSKKPKKPKPDTEVLRHKTFHRYTTRRKQGGSQSVNDNAKGPAKSAGALLRRYGEQALRDDIRNLLAEWEDDLNICERIWIRASGSNRNIFMDYDGAILNKTDERLRTFPFPTRRPTQSELARCLLELTKVKLSHHTEEELRAQDEEYLASLPKSRALQTATPATEVEKPKLQKLTKEEEALRDKWSRLLEMIAKGRLEPLKAFWEREGMSLGGANVQIPEFTGEKRATLLQVAAHSGQEEVTRWLLEDLRADPTVPVPNVRTGEGEQVDGNEFDPTNHSKGGGRTAYDLAHTKGVRDIFRRCAGAHPEWWDWFGEARVPSALNKEMEDDRDEKKKIRRRGLKDRVREREAKEREKQEQNSEPIVVEPAKPAKAQDPTAPQKLGGSSGSLDAVTGLTPEMRARVERERRARAAEARLKGLRTS